MHPDIRPAQFNAYIYSGNSPLTWSDPTGLFWGALGGGLSALGTALTIQYNPVYGMLDSGANGMDSAKAGDWENVGRSAQSVSASAAATAAVAIPDAAAARSFSGAMKPGLAPKPTPGPTLTATNKNIPSTTSSAKATKTADGGVDLFRHVSPGEMVDIGKNGFRPGAGSLDGKWFTEAGVHASQWGNVLNGGTGSVVKVRVPTSFGNELMRLEKLDGIGPARYVEPNQLAQLNRYGWQPWQ